VNVDELSACCDTNEQCTFAEIEIFQMSSIWPFYGIHTEPTKSKLISLYKVKLADIRLFTRAWDLTIEDVAMSDDFNGPFSSFGSIVDTILSPALERLHEFLKSLIDGNTETSLIDTFFNANKTDADDKADTDNNEAENGAVSGNVSIAENLTSDLTVLFNFFALLQKMREQKRFTIIKSISTNCRCYLKVKLLAKSYKNIILVKENLKLTGDFNIIEKLNEMV